MRFDFPPEFDPAFYRQAHADLAGFDDTWLRGHYDRHGRAEGRIASAGAGRSAFVPLFRGHRPALEIGPFNKPVLTGAGVRYFDVMDRAALIARASEIGQAADKVPYIDFVSPTADLSVVTGKFALVLSSHAIEHQPDLIDHLTKVAAMLAPGGVYAVIVPDCRYCFDHYLPPSHAGAVIEAHMERRTLHSLSSVIEHRALTTHNDTARHWAGDHGATPPRGGAGQVVAAIAEWQASAGRYLDVHAWQFTPDSFRHLMGLLHATGHSPLRPLRVYDTNFGANEFCAILGA